jgi:hypothetical protein
VQLDRVDSYSNSAENTGKDELRAITKELHFVSQNADSLIASTDAAMFLLKKMQEVHTALLENRPEMFSKTYHTRVHDSMMRLLGSMETYVKYLQSWKSRKDTAMNLVSLLKVFESINLINKH